MKYFNIEMNTNPQCVLCYSVYLKERERKIDIYIDI